MGDFGEVNRSPQVRGASSDVGVQFVAGAVLLERAGQAAVRFIECTETRVGKTLRKL